VSCGRSLPTLRSILGAGSGLRRPGEGDQPDIDSAGIIVGCAESKRMLSILSRVQLLGAAAKSFIEGRLAATKEFWIR